MLHGLRQYTTTDYFRKLNNNICHLSDIVIKLQVTRRTKHYHFARMVFLCTIQFSKVKKCKNEAINKIHKPFCEDQGLYIVVLAPNNSILLCR